MYPHEEDPQETTYVLSHEGRGLSYIFQIHTRSEEYPPRGVSVPLGKQYMVVKRIWMSSPLSDPDETMGAWTLEEARKLWKDLIADGFRRTR